VLGLVAVAATFGCGAAEPAGTAGQPAPPATKPVEPAGPEPGVRDATAGDAGGASAATAGDAGNASAATAGDAGNAGDAGAAEAERLDERVVRSVVEGPWTRRRVEAGAGTDGGGFGGLGIRGEGTGGGGGMGYGAGGLGSVATIGKGGGASSGGRPAAAPKLRGPGSADSEAPDGAAAKKQRPADDRSSAPLRAGSTDDNADFKGFLKFLATWTDRDDVRGQFQPMDVQGRGFVRVLDGDGRPVPGARLEIRAAGGSGPAWLARTQGDGRAPHYPRLFGPSQATKYDVVASVGDERLTATWDGADELTVRASAPRADGPMTLEVLFLIDTTGSMGDEIDRIKTSLLTVTGKAKAKRADLVLRYGAVLYRDLNDDYLTMAHPFTADLQAFDAALQAVTAGGGGDLPEALNQGLARAVDGMKWQEDAAKVVFLICDAPPQMRVKGDVLYGDSAVRAIAAGLRIHAVAASGLDPLGTLVLRQIAQLTRGKFIFIEYGGARASAARHGVTGPVEAGNNLDDIILAQISAEIDGWGR